MENKNELQGGYIMRILIVEDDPAQLELLKSCWKRKVTRSPAALTV